MDAVANVASLRLGKGVTEGMISHNETFFKHRYCWYEEDDDEVEVARFEDEVEEGDAENPSSMGEKTPPIQAAMYSLISRMQMLSLDPLLLLLLLFPPLNDRPFARVPELLLLLLLFPLPDFRKRFNTSSFENTPTKSAIVCDHVNVNSEL